MPALLPSLIYRGLHHFFVTEYKDAEALEGEAVGLATEARDGFHLANALFYLGLSLGNQGRVSEALGTLDRAHEMARRNSNQLTLSRVPNGVGWLYRELYETPTAVEHDRSGVEIARANGRAEAEANSLINLVYDYLQGGESEAGLRALNDVEPLTDRDPWNRWRFFDIRFHAAATELWLARKKFDLAYQHATELLGNASQHNVPKYICIAHKLLGQLHLGAGEYERAAFELRTALNHVRKHPAPLVRWKVDALLARALGRLGDLAGMQTALRSSAETINTIASHIEDATLKRTFLDARPVQAVFVSSGQPSAAG
jgi:tetratricopeptide (TPR) repeat protein